MLARAQTEIMQLPATQLIQRSSWHGTTPIGGASGQGEFINSAVVLDTQLSPQELASSLLAIESQLGRERVVRWDARTIDIDLLLYEQVVIDSPDLIVPHPRMSFRQFVLQPAAEIAGAMVHPTSGWTLAALNQHLQLAPRHVVITAREGKQADWLAEQLCETMKCELLDASNKKMGGESVSSTAEGIEFASPCCGNPPTLEIQSPHLLAEKKSDTSRPLPALTIFLDLENTGFTCLQEISKGPIAHITTDEPATILQESQAALRSIWPDLQ